MADPSDRVIAQLAERRFGDFVRIPFTWISGVEVTQSIQYYRAAAHLTDPNDRGADNSLRLAANKPAWVRVYVRSIIGEDVTATLEVRRRAFGFLFLPVATLTPTGAATVSAGFFTSYVNERTDITKTLNFVIPASQFTGNLRLTIRLTNAAGDRELDSERVFIGATLQQTLRLRSILVSYNGASTANVPAGSPPPPNLTLAAPTLGNVQTTSGRALLMMPVQSTGAFASAGTLAWNLPLDDARTGAGGCSNNWNQLLPALGNVRTNDGNRTDVVYYGLLPAGIPINVPGCGQNGLGAGRNGDQGTLVHEIGHGYGFQHTPCGAAGATDPNYPTYEPYPSASIGEYGFNISNGTVLSPATTSDYMSYCFPQWMSIYQHGRLINHARLDPQFVGDEPIWVDKLQFREYFTPRDLPDPAPDPWKQVEMRANSVISITGVVQSADEVEVRTVARAEAAGSPPGVSTGLVAELVDSEGRVLARGDVIRLHSHGGDCGCDDEAASPGPPYPFQAFVPNVERGAGLRISDGERAIWERRATSRPPKLGGVRAEVGDDGRLHVAWEGDIEGESPEVWLQWSVDEGRTWHGLATDIHDREALIDLRGLPAGEAWLRVLLHDGFDTAVSEPAPVRVPEAPPELAIFSPRDGEMLIVGRTLRLWGNAISSDGTPLVDDEALWRLDGEDVGRGFDLWLEAPKVGEHRATLVCGERAEDVMFRTVDPEADFGQESGPSFDQPIR